MHLFRFQADVTLDIGVCEIGIFHNFVVLSLYPVIITLSLNVIMTCSAEKKNSTNCIT